MTRAQDDPEIEGAFVDYRDAWTRVLDGGEHVEGHGRCYKAADLAVYEDARARLFDAFMAWAVREQEAIGRFRASCEAGNREQRCADPMTDPRWRR